jgi:hypothetical protein
MSESPSYGESPSYTPPRRKPSSESPNHSESPSHRITKTITEVPHTSEQTEEKRNKYSITSTPTHRK